MANFKNKWSTPAKQSLMQRIGDTVKPKGALKPRVVDGIKRLQLQIKKLDTMFFVCTGSEANDLAYRIAKTFTKSKDVLVMNNLYS